MGLLDRLFGKKADKKQSKTDLQPEVIETDAKVFSEEEYSHSKGIYTKNLLSVYIFELQPLLKDKEETSPGDFVLGEYIEMNEGLLTLGVAAKSSNEPFFMSQDSLTVSYSRHGESFYIEAGIVDVSSVKNDSPASLQDDFPDIPGIESAIPAKKIVTEKHIVQLILRTEPKRHKRKYGRISVKWKVHYRENDSTPQENTDENDTGQALSTAKTIDISEGGFRGNVDKLPEINSFINCIIEVDEDNKSEGELIGKVVRGYQIPGRFVVYEMTVQYIAMDSSVRAFLSGWIEKMQPAAVNAEARTTISTTGTQASIELLPPENNGADLTYDELCARLESEHIKHGIDFELLKKLAEKPSYNREYVIARYTPPVHGTDALETYYVDMNPEFTPKIGDDGVADFKDIGLIQKVIENEILAEKVPATAGEPGVSVTGDVLEAIPGKDINLPAGKNTVINDSDTALLAAVDGYVSIVDGKINVFDTYVVNGDVQYSTGNIDHNGIVVVKGDVRSGFSVRATGDIVVHGSIESASVSAGGTLVVHGGCVGEDNNVTAGGNVAVKYIDGGSLNIKGSLTTSYILNATVRCGESVEMAQPGLIRNSHVMAKTAVNAITIGGIHSGGDRTVIEVGNDPEAVRRLENLTAELEKLEKGLEVVRTNIHTLTLNKYKQGLSEEKADMLESSKQLANQFSAKQERLLEIYNELKLQIEKLGYGTVTVQDVAYEGLKVIIGPREFVLRDTVKAAKFRRTGEGVIIEGLD